MSELQPLEASHRLALSFSTLLRGLLYPGSEGDSPYLPFHVGFDPSEHLSPESFRAANDMARYWTIDLEEESGWFDDMISASDANDSSGLQTQAYEYLRREMAGTLPAPLFTAVATVPEQFTFHRTRHYVFGRVPEGGLAGIVTYSVET
jgi:hypothetical protein